MSQVFHGTIFSFPSKLKFDPEVEARAEQMRDERAQLQKQLESEGFYNRDHSTVIPFVNPNSPIYSAIQKALGN